VRRVVVLAIVLTLAWATVPVRAAEPFEGSVSRLDASTRGLMRGSSWRPGCPVSLDRLREVRVTYVSFDGRPRHGRLVLHRRWADELLEVFRRLYTRGFPIRRVRLVDRYDADDRESMRHDNTSAFNCRTVAGTDVWSQHAYGRAIDIDPVENPYVDGSYVSPRRGRDYVDRSDVRPGMIVKRDAVWRAFHRIGWEWGGAWRSAQDYQHFSSNGR
jgi:poly-gamma-glutamate synthesis protein (capsule biosynthesis protein)